MGKGNQKPSPFPLLLYPQVFQQLDLGVEESVLVGVEEALKEQQLPDLTGCPGSQPSTSASAEPGLGWGGEEG